MAVRAIVILGCLSWMLGCGAGPDGSADAGAPTTAGGGAPREAETLPLPGEEAVLPPGHPPTGGSGGLVWVAPSGWAAQTPTSSMRYAQYVVEGPDGPAECAVFYFGANQGGDAMANANRWAGQFSQPDGSSSVDRMVVERLDGAEVPVVLVEVRGTFEGGMTGSDEPFEPQPNYMLLGGIVEGPDAPWFFKLTGPERTVEAQRDAFIGMMESIRAEG